MQELIIIGLVLVAMLAVVAAYQQRTALARLKSNFGPEYQRLADRGESTRSIRRELHERETRVARLHIVPLSEEQKGRMLEDWRSIQARFVDEPAAAIADAEQLLETVMRARGYPAATHARRLADLSVNHVSALQNYREARKLAALQSEGQATTEDLRQAMVLYRSLFEDLLER